MIRRGRSRSVSLPRRLLEDERLSFRAAGVAGYLLSKPEGWRIDGRALARTHREGRDAVYAALKELEDAGYLVRRRYQDDKTGRWWTESVLYETPEAAVEEADDPPPPAEESAPTESGIPGPGGPGPGGPGPGAPGLGQPVPKSLLERERTPLPPESEAEGKPPAPPGDATPRQAGTNPRALGVNPRGPRRPPPVEPATAVQQAQRATFARHAQHRAELDAETATAARLDPAEVRRRLSAGKAALVHEPPQEATA